MVGLLAPLWLAGLAALALPLALHLWDRRTGPAVRVGSIRLLTGAPPPMARRPRLHDPWLLAVRCAMLATLVVALARPYWAPADRRTPPVWALVAPDVVDHDDLVDSLRRNGRTLRALDPGDVWLSLLTADAAAPPGTRLEVYTTPLLRGARGTRPILRSAVTWHPRPSISRAGSPSPRATPRIVTVIADPARRDDARYVVAAIQAAAVQSGLPAIVTTGASPGSVDWILWLSDQPLSDAVRQRLASGATVLTDVGPTPAAVAATRISFGSGSATVRRSLERDEGVAVWTDVAGAPLLTVRRDGRGLLYRFHSRFTPAWSDIVLHPEFPEAIARLWIGSDSTRLGRDDRPITVSQVLPAHEPSRSGATRSAGARSLFLPLWLVALGLFLVERRIAARGVPQ